MAKWGQGILRGLGSGCVRCRVSGYRVEAPSCSHELLTRVAFFRIVQESLTNVSFIFSLAIVAMFMPMAARSWPTPSCSSRDRRRRSSSCAAATTVTQPKTRAVLSNSDVVQMVKAGLGAEIIVAKIKSTTCSFETSPTALKELKDKGTPDSVILAMVQVPKN